MTEDDVMTLLERIESLDGRRTFQHEHVQAWHAVAQHAAWNLDGALRAVAAHYAEKGTWLMPADITTYLRRPAESGQRICEF